MLGEAINYPMNRDDWIKQVVIGWVLLILSFLIIPWFIVEGYLIDVLRQSEAGDDQPPAFEDWGSLLVDGLKAFVISFVYLLIPSIVFFVTVGGSLMAMLAGGGAAAGLAGLFGGLAITFVLYLVFGYFLLVGLANFAKNDSLGSAFDFGTVIDVGLSGDYLIGWLMAVVLIFVANIIVGVLNIIPILGLIIGLVVSFYASVAAFNIVGRAFAEAQAG